MEDLIKSKCCICSQPMAKSQHLNMVILNKKPTWEYPKVGNVLYDVAERATATLCDKCIDGFDEAKIKWAIELRGGKVIYHAVENLESISEPPSAPMSRCNQSTCEYYNTNMNCYSCDVYIESNILHDLKVGSIFYSKGLRNKQTGECLRIEIMEIDSRNDAITVDYGSGAGWDKWIFSHVVSGFAQGEYAFKAF